jgi:hypothetical protein
MKNLYFNDLDAKLQKSFRNLDYVSRRSPLMRKETGQVCFKANRLLSNIFSQMDLDFLWDDLKKGVITKEELMDLYRSGGYSLESFIEIFCED